MDDADRASIEYEKAMEAFRLSRLRESATKQTICECGNPIGEIRAGHGYTTCIECATAAEAKQNQYR